MSEQMSEMNLCLIMATDTMNILYSENETLTEYKLQRERALNDILKNDILREAIVAKMIQTGNDLQHVLMTFIGSKEAE